MEFDKKIKEFEYELNLIKDEKIRLFAKESIRLLPDYFFEIPASSTGKYHPSYALGNGGLVRHTKAAIRIAVELFRLDWWHFTEEEEDLIIASIFVHDGWKSGLNQKEFSVINHPIIASLVVSGNETLRNILPEEKVMFVADNIKTHMGQWTKDYKTGEEVLEKPETKYQKFVHLADYLASRKCLEFNFDAEISKS